jgi:phospholipid/cholesterol/gamma-HCH transport system permease protein
MVSEKAPSRAPAAPPAPAGRLFDPTRILARLAVAQGMADLAVRTARCAVTPPFPWVKDWLEECSTGIRRCAVPLFLSVTFFSVGLVVTTIGGILASIGTIDRLGGGIVTGFPRETAFWVTGMVFAGVVGGAITADLGARRVREELDAVRVLGVDPVRTLVVPRVLALITIAPILGIAALINAILVIYITAPMVNPSLQPAVYLETAADFATTVDAISLLLRLLITGAFVGIVASYKGINASGGTAGVGRAVNEAVVITFFGLWAFNSLWNSVVLAAFPDGQGLRG